MSPTFLRPPPRAPVLLAIALLLAGCVNVSPAGTTIASQPPGARVHVDGRDSGWVTPCRLALEEDETHVVRVALDGYTAREVVLTPERRRGVVDWRHGVNGVRSTVRFPVLLPSGDFLFPFWESDALAPGRVFVHLWPESAP